MTRTMLLVGIAVFAGLVAVAQDARADAIKIEAYGSNALIPSLNAWERSEHVRSETRRFRAALTLRETALRVWDSLGSAFDDEQRLASSGESSSNAYSGFGPGANPGYSDGRTKSSGGAGGSGGGGGGGGSSARSSQSSVGGTAYQGMVDELAGDALLSADSASAGAAEGGASGGSGGGGGGGEGDVDPPAILISGGSKLDGGAGVGAVDLVAPDHDPVLRSLNGSPNQQMQVIAPNPTSGVGVGTANTLVDLINSLELAPVTLTARAGVTESAVVSNPEPASLLLMGSGLWVASIIRRRRRKQ